MYTAATPPSAACDMVILVKTCGIAIVVNTGALWRKVLRSASNAKQIRMTEEFRWQSPAGGTCTTVENIKENIEETGEMNLIFILLLFVALHSAEHRRIRQDSSLTHAARPGELGDRWPVTDQKTNNVK